MAHRFLHVCAVTDILLTGAIYALQLPTNLSALQIYESFKSSINRDVMSDPLQRAHIIRVVVSPPSIMMPYLGRYKEGTLYE